MLTLQQIWDSKEIMGANATAGLSFDELVKVVRATEITLANQEGVKLPWSFKLPCNVPPKGWLCTRESGHDGPCAAVPQFER
jgi:hypothetical protein